jgi:hypothetical protein
MPSAWPTLGVLIPTYRRHEIVAQTVALLRENLCYSGEIEILVSEDGPDLPPVWQDGVRVIAGPGRGLGANLNALLSASVHCEVLLQSDDDNHLSGPLDLDPHVRTLLQEPLAGWIRLQYVADHHFRATLKGSYWWVDWDSPELYITSNKAHLKHRRFHDTFGMYPEDLNLAETENGFCWQCKDMAALPGVWPQVLVPLDVATESLWQHVGPSWQSKGF